MIDVQVQRMAMEEAPSSKLGATEAADSRSSGVPRTLLDRLSVRRWLVLTSLLVPLALVYGFGLSWRGAAAAAVMLIAALALVPVRRSSGAGALLLNRREEGEAKGLRALIDALSEPAILLTRNGNIYAANARARDQYANLRSGAHISSALRQPEILEALERSRKTREPVTAVFTQRVPVESRVAAMLAWIDPDMTQAPSAPALLITMRDLTEQERTAQMRTEFIANASHELRTPLASLLGFIETLQGSAKEDPEARERFLGIMAAQAQRMTRLIDDLLSLSQVEMRAHLRPNAIVDMVRTVRAVADSMEPVAAKAGTSLAVSVPDEPAPVRGDRDELVQALQNLIQNAIKYGRKGGNVTVSLSRRPAAQRTGPARVAISVADDGPGIGPEHVPRLTERFYRVDVASSRDKGGTGLGLAIVKHIVNRHRGNLEIRSRPGEGSTFSLVLDEAAQGGDAVPATASESLSTGLLANKDK
ncbi:MAG: ATP-binding protein [Pseudomonadota bacterium]|nr:ATP-binding protein [Pseudomonadota bacterium]